MVGMGCRCRGRSAARILWRRMPPEGYHRAVPRGPGAGPGRACSAPDGRSGQVLRARRFSSRYPGGTDSHFFGIPATSSMNPQQRVLETAWEPWNAPGIVDDHCGRNEPVTSSRASQGYSRAGQQEMGSYLGVVAREASGGMPVHLPDCGRPGGQWTASPPRWWPPPCVRGLRSGRCTRRWRLSGGRRVRRILAPRSLSNRMALPIADADAPTG